ncbi:MAG: PQQ-dependent sugar dehydrogenase [Acidobacteriota bacterium]|nr:PQQ-dependent sugar dehydrogenase [Acidobacteriota bacterium]MDE3265516.1 PQQ-dependent sugar dehydrogenase [Acidobacteriota bacterium]
MLRFALSGSRPRLSSRNTVLRLCAFFLTVAFVSGTAAADDELRLDAIELPAGFSIGVFAAEIDNARSLAQSPSGTVFVGTGRRGGGVVHAVVDRDGDGEADSRYRIGSDLNWPNGVAFHEGDLYVAEISRVLRFEEIESRLDSPPSPVVVTADLPEETHHGWKFIRFGPDGRLYVPVGAPCNICDEGDPYATILRLDQAGDYDVVARGVRNTVGFDWRPGTRELWFTDNGRDMMGDDVPPDELNVLTEDGQHFGYPYCHGQDIPDPEFGDERPCGELVPPAIDLDPHVAAVGMRFYRGDAFPERYRGQIFIAEHGSWNRSNKIGYRVMVVHVDPDGRAREYEEFATGWLQGEDSWGRPVDVMELADGSLLVSDDLRGVIYRIVYDRTAAAAAGQ